MLKKDSPIYFYVLFFLFWIIGTFYISFQYFRIADFPIGHDVINHIQRGIQMQQHMDFKSIFRDTIYPIPAVLFVWFYDFFHKFFGWDWPRVFLFVECFYLFLTALLVGIFSWFAFKKWPIVIITSFLVASSRWLGGSLYTGLMGEIFGWVAFMVCFILLFNKKWFWFAIAFIFLAFSHPLPFGVMCIYLIIYLIYQAISQKKYWNMLAGFAILLIVLATGYYLFPEKRTVIIDILGTKFPLEGEWHREYVIGSDYRRFNQYLLGGLGFLTLWLGKNTVDKEKRKTLLLFSILSFFVTFKYLFGIHYLSFRYYTYFEVMNSVLAAYMIWYIAYNLSELKTKISQSFMLYALCFILGFFAIWPNIHATDLFVKSQLVENFATTTPIPERTLIKAEVPKLHEGVRILGQKIWVWWFQAYGNMTGSYMNNIYSSYEKVYQENPNDLINTLNINGIKYLYFSSEDPSYQFESALFLIKVYDTSNIRIYEVK